MSTKKLDEIFSSYDWNDAKDFLNGRKSLQKEFPDLFDDCRGESWKHYDSKLHNRMITLKDIYNTEGVNGVEKFRS
jgi:hypothetical protein